MEPKFIVCDEPVSALDVSIQAQILNLLKELQESMGLTYIFITHDLSVVNYFSDDIAVMYLGKLVEKAETEELFEHPMHPYTQALLSAIPIPEVGAKGHRIMLKGELSSPIDPPDECRFAGRCDLCPLRALCRALAEGATERYPVRSAPRPRRVEERTVLLLRSGGKTAIRRREEKGLLAGLWELPSLDGFRSAGELRVLYPGALSITPCGEARHLFTHIEWRMRGFQIELPEALPDFVWEDAETIRASYSFPTALKYYLKRL